MARTRQPNILFLLPDQHRPDWVGSNPNLALRTPVLDSLMARGMTFLRAYSPSPVCAPARACLASARDYATCGVPNNRYVYPLDQATYYQRLRDAGYRVAGVGKFDLHKDTSDASQLFWGLDGSRSIHDWGFTEGIDNEGKVDGSTSYLTTGEPRGPYLKALADAGLADRYVAEHETMGRANGAYVTALPEELYCDNWLTENGLRFIQGFPAGKPWHLVVNFTGPHNPFDVTQRMHDDWADASLPQPIDPKPGMSPDAHLRIRRHYAAMIENIDRLCGKLIDAVAARGELDDTLIVFASDHGEMLGDLGCWGKSIWREASVGIPLVIAGPDVREGVVSDTLVGLHDLAATFMDLAGAPELPGQDAISLVPVLQGERDTHRVVFTSALNHWRAVITSRYKLVEEKGNLLLFDREQDPAERHNIAASQPEIVGSLRPKLPAMPTVV